MRTNPSPARSCRAGRLLNRWLLGAGAAAAASPLAGGIVPSGSGGKLRPGPNVSSCGSASGPGDGKPSRKQLTHSSATNDQRGTLFQEWKLTRSRPPSVWYSHGQGRSTLITGKYESIRILPQVSGRAIESKRRLFLISAKSTMSGLPDADRQWQDRSNEEFYTFSNIISTIKYRCIR